MMKIEGMAPEVGAIDENLARDGRLSRDELYILIYFLDITPVWQRRQIARWGGNSQDGHTLNGRGLDVMRGPTLQPMIARFHPVVTVNHGKNPFAA